MTETVQPDVRPFHDEPTGTFSYLVSDPQSKRAAVIDPVLGFSNVSGRTDHSLAESIVAFAGENGLRIDWILDTHAHADHLSAAAYLKERSGAPVAIGTGITKVQDHFGPIFNLAPPFAADGHQFDHLFADGEEFDLGSVRFRVLATPGHTNDSVTYLAGRAAFVGDTLFAPDLGTARCDFPGGDAGRLYDSIQALYALPDDTDIYLCHDYPPADREPRHCIPIAEQRRDNVHIRTGISREEFVRMRETRDAGLDLPRLIVPSIQVNIQAGRLPAVDDNGVSYIRIPVDTL